MPCHFSFHVRCAKYGWHYDDDDFEVRKSPCVTACLLFSTRQTEIVFTVHVKCRTCQTEHQEMLGTKISSNLLGNSKQLHRTMYIQSQYQAKPKRTFNAENSKENNRATLHTRSANTFSDRNSFYWVTKLASQLIMTTNETVTGDVSQSRQQLTTAQCSMKFYLSIQYTSQVVWWIKHRIWYKFISTAECQGLGNIHRVAR